MDYMLLSVLKSINQSLICKFEGSEMIFKNRDEAIDMLQKADKKYSLASISAQDNIVVLTIQDTIEEIEQHNKELITEYKKQYGYEPSFF